MAATKTVTVLNNNTVLTAGGGNTTSTVGDLTTSYGSQLLLSILNGATGPTIAGQCQVQVSGDNSNWYNFGGALVSTLGNNVQTTWAIFIPIGIQYVKVVSGSNTGQNVTLRVEVESVTKLY